MNPATLDPPSTLMPEDWGAPAPMPARAHGTSSFREILTTVFHDRRRILAVLSIGLLATAIAAALAPKKYVAEASLLLRLGREYIYTPEVGDPGAAGAPVAYDREQTVVAETKILTSRDLKESVLNKMGVAKVFPAIADKEGDPVRQKTAALLTFEKALEADILKGSNLMQVTFEHADAAIAAKVLSQVIDDYLQRRSIIFASASYGTAEAEFGDRKAQLEAAEAKLADAKSARNIRAFGEEQSLLLAQRNALEMRQTDMSLAAAQARGRTDSLRGSLRNVSGEVTLSSETQRSEAIENARKLLLDLKLKERDLSSRYLDTSPFVQDVRADIDRTGEFVRELESKPQRFVKTGRSPTRDAVESDLLRSMADRQQARRGASMVATQRVAIEARLADFAESERLLPALERDRRLAEANFDAAAKRLRDENALAELDRKRRSNVSIVQSPQVPLVPKTYLPVILLVGTLLSLGAALLTAFLSALWRDTFLTPEQAERELGLPLLAAVPLGKP